MDEIARLGKGILASSRVFLIGNGGSAANAIHIANDWIACGIDARALTADIATLTAIANDFGYKHIFSRQLYVMGEKDALLIALSGSGNSPNILGAIRAAKKKNMTTWAIIGAWTDSNGRLGKASRSAHHVIARGANMQSAEEWQVRIGHEVMRCLKAG